MTIEYNPSIITDGLVLCLDAANIKSYSPNRHPKPTDVYGWVNSPTGNQCTLSRDSIQSPVGSSPMKMVITGNDPHTQTFNSSSIWNICPVNNGETWTISVYTKASQNLTGQLFVFGADNGGSSFISGNWIGINSKTFNISTNWTRANVQITFANTLIKFIQCRLDGPDTNGSGNTIWWDGLQVERNSTPTNFNPFTGSNTVINLVGSDTFNVYGNTSFNGSTFTFPNNQTDSYIMNSAYPMPVNDHTIDCWFYSNFTSPNQTPYTYSVSGDNSYLFFINNSTEIAPHTFGNSYPISVSSMTNRWINFTRTRIKFTGEENYYINGNLVGSRIIAPNTSCNPNGYMIIGQESDSPGGGFDPNQNLDGSFNLLSVYNRALSSDEIMQNFAARRGRFGV